MKKLLFLLPLAGALIAVCGKDHKSAGTGYYFDGSLVNFYADSLPNVKWMIDSGEMKVTGDKDLLIRRLVWMFDSVLALNRKYVAVPVGKDTFYYNIDPPNGNDAGTYGISGATEWKSYAIRAKRHFLIGYIGTGSDGFAYAGGFDTTMTNYPSFASFVRYFEIAYDLHRVKILSVTEYTAADRKQFLKGADMTQFSKQTK